MAVTTDHMLKCRDHLVSAAHDTPVEVKLTSDPRYVFVGLRNGSGRLEMPLYLGPKVPGSDHFGLAWYWRNGDMIAAVDQPREVIYRVAAVIEATSNQA